MAYPPAAPLAPDPGFAHFLRMTGVGISMSLSVYALGAGFLWYFHCFSRTGYRKRDWLLTLIPVYGIVISTRVLWRYTARDVYWDKRPDRPSDVLGGWPRPTAIAAGWIAFGLIIVAAMAGAFDEQDGWTEFDRASLRQALEVEGVIGSEARCVVRIVEMRIDNPNTASDSQWESAFESAFLDCQR